MDSERYSGQLRTSHYYSDQLKVAQRTLPSRLHFLAIGSLFLLLLIRFIGVVGFRRGLNIAPTLAVALTPGLARQTRCLIALLPGRG